MVCNTTFKKAPWADALFAMDHAWWVQYHQEVREIFTGGSYTVNNIGKQFANVVTIPRPFTGYGNSGAGAVNLAAQGNPAKILLLGYDCQHTGGQRHWHGNHPRGLGNADVVSKWPAQFKKLHDHLPGVTIINCSRQTALREFPIGVLEEELCAQLLLTHPQARSRRRSSG